MHDFKLLKRFYIYIKPYQWKLLVAMLLSIPIGALDGVVAYSLKPFIDAAQVQKTVTNLDYIPLVIIGFTIIQGALSYLSTYLNGWLGLTIMQDIQRVLFCKLQTMHVQYFDKTSSGKVIKRYLEAPKSLQMNFLNSIKELLSRFSSAAFLCGVLIITSWKLSITAIFILFLVLFPSTRIRSIIKSFVRDSEASLGEFVTFYNDTVGGIRLIQSFNYENQRFQRFQKQQQRLFGRTMRKIKATGWLTPSMHMISSIGIALIIWQGSHLIASGELTTGTFVSFMVAMLMLYQPIKNMGGSLVNVQLSIYSLERVLNTLDEIPKIIDAPDAIELDSIQTKIKFHEVWLKYTKGKWVLQNINLLFRMGETVAIVGPSGGGKTSLINVLLRFYDTNSGAILVDGKDIRKISRESLRRNIALVGQDNFIFSGSLYDNLLLGNPNATEEEMLAALEKACLLDFVQGLPDGIHTVIGERGRLLSGGQCQRVAIARVFLKDAKVLILDEATSALDNESEALVQQALERLMEGRTVIIIAHRLSTIINADRIVVLENGEVVEEGKHHELLAANKTYARLYKRGFGEERQEQASLLSASS